MNHRLEFKAMGCRMIALVDSPAESAPALLEQVPAWFETWEQCLSRFRPDSELNRLNNVAGWTAQVSETLWQVFQTALEAEKASSGLALAIITRTEVKINVTRIAKIGIKGRTQTGAGARSTLYFNTIDFLRLGGKLLCP